LINFVTKFDLFVLSTSKLF